MKLFATEVFTPNDFPTHTYVARDEERLEQKLRDALRTPKMVVSISGPSKSGKTVLVGKVVGSENIIPVSGIELKTADDLPLMALSWMDAPSTTSVEDGTTTDNTVGGEASGQGAFLFGKVEGKANYQRKKSKALGGGQLMVHRAECSKRQTVRSCRKLWQCPQYSSQDA